MKVLENGADEQLRVAAAQRDPALFAELYESNFDRVYAYIARRVPTLAPIILAQTKNPRATLPLGDAEDNRKPGVQKAKPREPQTR